MSGKGSEVPKGNDNNRIDALKKQYDKLTEDWRYFNNLIWGVPTVAIAIMTGIMIGAYQNLHDGSWERIASLSIGSFFLLALTIEVIRKRYHMNVISSLLKDLQVELGLQEKFQFPLGISDDIDKYLDKKRIVEGIQFSDYKRDPLFEFLAIFYARKYLTYVIFSAAIILAILAEWEFIKYQMIGRWTLVTGITVGIIAITIPVVRYAQVWYQKKKKPLLSIEVAKVSLNQGDEQTLTITTKNRKSNKPISGAMIKCGIFLCEEKKLQLGEGVTNGEGKYSYTLKTDKSWEPGKYNVKVGVVAKCYKNEYNTAKIFEVKTSKMVDND
jgi:hypothetical protein